MISQNMKAKKPKEVKEKLIINRRNMKFEKYWWFIKDKFIIMCGKSADDNEA